MEKIKDFFGFWKRRVRFFWLEYLRHFSPKSRKTIVSNRMPIVLVAGIYASGRSFAPLKKFLEARGWPVDVDFAKRNVDELPLLAEKLKKRIEKIPAKKVQIVAHSLGGLTTLAVLADPKIREKVELVITLGSPFRGCFLGNIAFWEAKRNQKYVAMNSVEIQKLTENRAANHKIRALHASFDEIVFPKEITILRGARENYEIDVVGHVGLILAKTAWYEIARRLI